jgi:hypothetical protein
VYGDKAEGHAVLKIEQQLQKGDSAKADVWIQIRTAIVVLRIAAPNERT